MELTPKQMESMRYLTRVSQISAYNIASVLGRSLVNQTNTIERPPVETVTVPCQEEEPRRPRQELVYLTERQRCLLFVQILLRYLAKVNLVSLRKRTKHVVTRCVREHRQRGMSSEEPLSESVEYEIRQCVGEVHYGRAQRGMTLYCNREGYRLTHASQVQAV